MIGMIEKLDAALVGIITEKPIPSILARHGRERIILSLLQALREPTEGITNAMAETCADYPGSVGMFEAMFTAAIDSILQDESKI